MKNSWLILGILGVGGLAYYIYNKNKSTKKIDVEKVSSEIKAKDENKFTNAFLTQYDIIVAPVRVSQKAKMIADDIITSRNENAQKRLDSYKPSYI
jgi:hypothetical protein